MLTDTRCIGYHPWWAHQIALTKPESKRKHYESLLLSPSSSGEDLAAFEKILENQPEPRLLDDILSEVRKNVLDFPNALVGEIGLDRAVRIPYDYDATPRILPSLTIPFEHQLKIFEASSSVSTFFTPSKPIDIPAPARSKQRGERKSRRGGFFLGPYPAFFPAAKQLFTARNRFGLLPLFTFPRASSALDKQYGRSGFHGDTSGLSTSWSSYAPMSKIPHPKSLSPEISVLASLPLSTPS